MRGTGNSSQPASLLLSSSNRQEQIASLAVCGLPESGPTLHREGADVNELRSPIASNLFDSPVYATMEFMQIHAVAARRPYERRTPLAPDGVRHLLAAGHGVSIEAGVGVAAGHSNDAYREAGAEVGNVTDPDLVVCVEPPAPETVAGADAVLGLLEPLDDPRGLAELAKTKATLLPFELVPRTTRAQSVDVLSSQASLAGYQAVVEGAVRVDRIFPMMTTAAGTLRPAKVVVLGAGVAGLAAIAAARRLGAVVWAFDVRAAAGEQVESLGARFIEVDLEAQDASSAGGYAREVEIDTEQLILQALEDHVAGADLVVTTAAIPGRQAPRLVTKDMVQAMRPGSVVVDGAAATGGNCEVSVAGEVVDWAGVTVMAPLDLASGNANHASQLFSRNVTNFVQLLSDENGGLAFDGNDDVVEQTIAARNGELVHPLLLELTGGA